MQNLGFYFNSLDVLNARFEALYNDAFLFSLLTLFTVVLFAIVSLLINRRALIVSGLLSMGVSLGVLISQFNVSFEMIQSFTLISLGLFVVFLGAAWHPVRRFVRTPFPKVGLLAKIFPL